MKKYNIHTYKDHCLFDMNYEHPFEAVIFEFVRSKSGWWETVKFSSRKDWNTFVRQVNNANKQLKKIKPMIFDKENI